LNLPRALSLALFAAAACGGPQKLGSTGATCFRDDDCEPGMICVAPTADDIHRVCSTDPTPLISMVEGPPVMAMAGAGMAGTGGVATGGAATAGATDAGTDSGGTAAAGKAGAGGKAGAAGTGAGGSTTAGAGGTDATAGTGGTAGTAPDGGAPP